MKSIKDALQLTDPNEILVEIVKRRKCIDDMVGRLYPSILQDEIDKLHEHWYDICYPNRVIKGNYQI